MPSHHTHQSHQIPQSVQLMQEIRQLNRSLLLHYHAVAADAGFKLADASSVDLLQQLEPAKIHYIALAYAVQDLLSTYTEEQLTFLTKHISALNRICETQIGRVSGQA